MKTLISGIGLTVFVVLMLLAYANEYANDDHYCWSDYERDMNKNCTLGGYDGWDHMTETCYKTIEMHYDDQGRLIDADAQKLGMLNSRIDKFREMMI